MLGALFLLASINILFALVGIIVLLAVLLIIKRKWPQAFAGLRKEKKESGTDTPSPEANTAPKKVKTYVILREQEGMDRKDIVVNSPVFCIGRSAGNDYTIQDPRVGRKHLCIEYSIQDDTCYAIDQGSVNGTCVNGRLLEAGKRYQLIHGDQLVIGKRTYTVEYMY